MLSLPKLDILPSLNEQLRADQIDTFVLIYDQSELQDGPLRFKQVLSRIRAKVREFPKFQHLYRPSRLIPGGQDWMLDENFDVEFHVRHLALPKPGDWRQFCIQVARLHARPLDTKRPLWEINVIEGLDHIPWLKAGHFALVCKIHSKLMETEHSQDLIWSLHDEFEADRSDPDDRDISSLIPLMSLWRQGSDKVLRPLTAPVEMMLDMGRNLAEEIYPSIKFYTSAFLGRRAVPFTRFNTHVSSFRAWESWTPSHIDWAELHRRYPSVTDRDLMMALISGALRHYLMEKSELGHRDLKALVLTEGSEQQMQVKTINLDVLTQDPVERLLMLSRRNRQQPEEAEADLVPPMASPLQKASQGVTLLHELQVRDGAGNPLANTALISLDNAHSDLHLHGAKLVHYSGVPEIANGLGLMHLITHCHNHVNLAVTSCREMLPDPGHYRECIERSMQELLDVDQVDKD